MANPWKSLDRNSFFDLHVLSFYLNTQYCSSATNYRSACLEQATKWSDMELQQVKTYLRWVRSSSQMFRLRRDVDDAATSPTPIPANSALRISGHLRLLPNRGLSVAFPTIVTWALSKDRPHVRFGNSHMSDILRQIADLIILYLCNQTLCRGRAQCMKGRDYACRLVRRWDKLCKRWNYEVTGVFIWGRYMF